MDDSDIRTSNAPHRSSDVPTSKGLESTGVGRPIPRSQANDPSSSSEVPLPKPTGYSGHRTPYIRQPRPRKTQEAIDDMAQDETYSAGFAHDSNYAVGGASPISGMGYRRSRADMGRLQHDLHYGQYLEIPKGKRQIFTSREQQRAMRSRAATVGVIIFLIVAVIIIASVLGAA